MEESGLEPDFARLSSYRAVVELHHGRIEWLAEHIRLNNFQIHELVARKILAMIERTEKNCDFEITLRRRTGLRPAQKNVFERAVRDLELALAVGRKCGFKRGHIKRACAEIARELSHPSSGSGLAEEYIEKCARPYKSAALAIIAEEEARVLYERGERDFLGRPICHEKPFAGIGDGE